MRFFFFSNEHFPVHIHATYQGCETKAEIYLQEGSTRFRIKLIDKVKPLPSKKRKEFEEFVEIKALEIVEKWQEFFQKGQIIKCQNIMQRLRK